MGLWGCWHGAPPPRRPVCEPFPPFSAFKSTTQQQCGFSPETIWSCWKRGHPGLLWAAGAAGLPLATQRMFPLICTEHGWPPSVPRLMWFLTVWRWKLLSFPACCLKFFSKACIFWRLGVRGWGWGGSDVCFTNLPPLVLSYGFLGQGPWLIY